MRISLGTAVFILFLVLKLTEVIDWSWRWITSPLWVPLALIVGFYLIIVILVIIMDILN